MQVKLAILLAVFALAGCDQIIPTFSPDQAGSLQAACSANGGYIAEVHTSANVPYSIRCTKMKVKGS